MTSVMRAPAIRVVLQEPGAQLVIEPEGEGDNQDPAEVIRQTRRVFQHLATLREAAAGATSASGAVAMVELVSVRYTHLARSRYVDARAQFRYRVVVSNGESVVSTDVLTTRASTLLRQRHWDSDLELLYEELAKETLATVVAAAEEAMARAPEPAAPVTSPPPSATRPSGVW